MFFGNSGGKATDVQSWGWYNGEPWPKVTGWLKTDNMLAKVGEKLNLDLTGGVKQITWHDADGDGAVEEAGFSLFDWDKTDGDRVIIDGKAKVVSLVLSFSNSTMVVNGVKQTVDAAVLVFSDGTYMVRIPDSAIPADATAANFQSLKLGNWNGRDYSGIAYRNYDQSLATASESGMCFVAGTLIDTPEGPRAVEDLRAGDLVNTLDEGAQPLRWAGARTMSGQGRMAPIRFAAGTIGNDRELALSPQHRVLLEGWRAEVMFGSDQVLSAARHLVNDRTIRSVPCDTVTYVHILFDRHQLVRSNGAWTESFHPGERGAQVMNDQWDEIVAIFPELAEGVDAYPETARTCLKAWEARALTA